MNAIEQIRARVNRRAIRRQIAIDMLRFIILPFLAASLFIHYAGI